MNLVSLQLNTTNNFEENLQNLTNIIEKIEQHSLILAPELALSGYAYDKMDEAFEISKIAIKLLTKLSSNQTIAITFIIKKNTNFYNTFYLFHKGKIIHTQSKHKLFILNDENKYFTSGDETSIKLIEIEGLKIGILICFELRFIELLTKLKGADIILIPAMWGKSRKEHLETLTKSLAIMNQCYVVVSNSADDNMAKGSGIITPFGDEFKDDSQSIISKKFNSSLIKKMRRYINIGIN